MKAADWIDRVKTARHWDSDYRVAKELGVNRATISNYRIRESTLDETTSIRVAKLIGLNPAGVILDQVAERSKDPEVRSTLSKVAGDLCILC